MDPVSYPISNITVDRVKPLTKTMASRFIPTIATQSLGRCWYHSLEHKLEVCAQYGFEAIELFFEDLEAVAKSLPSSHRPLAPGTTFSGSTDEQERQLAAADYIGELCVHHNLEILCLQPFMHYDGLVDRQAHDEAVKKLHLWIRLAQRLGTDLIQIPSNFLPSSQSSGDRRTIVADLREVAEIGLQTQPPTRFAYEALCWGTHVDKWDDAWDIVMEVDRSNFGTCIDTFNLAGRIFADPASFSGLNTGAHEAVREALSKLRRELPRAMQKVFYVEVCDGERLDHPLLSDHPWYEPDQKVRMTWSRNARLFPFEKPGYLPALEIFEAVCEAGYTGHVSFELFSRTANQPEVGVSEQHAKRGAVAWSKLVDHMGWAKNMGRDHVDDMRSQSSEVSHVSLSSSPEQ
jgi:4-hydroxyphenylpyruvate dioxygenase